MTTKTIKEICAEYGLSQIGLARKFDIPYRTVQDWCRGLRVPPEYVVKMIEELLKRGCENDEQRKEDENVKTTVE